MNLVFQQFECTANILNYGTRGTDPPGPEQLVMTSFTAQAATGDEFELAEGVIWDEHAALVRWVDVWKGRVHSGRMVEGAIDEIVTLEIGESAGAVAIALDGGLLVAGARGLVVISPDGTLSRGPDLLGDRRDVRFNDGAVDPQGRFLVGTLALGPETGEEMLLRISPDGSCDTLRTGIRLSNGIAFSPDGATVYHVDTLARTVSSHSYGADTFDLDEPWRTLPLELPHHPDGLTVSSDGSLWIAQWGGASVRRHAPDGTLIDTVAVDAQQVSCPAFVGADLDVLAITTAQEGLESWADASGSIFLADVGATGLPVPRWAGSTHTPYWQQKETITT